MNCQDINRILNEADHQPLHPEDQARLEAHLKECASCREEWNAQQLFASLSIPVTPEGLLERLCTVIDRYVGGNVIPFRIRPSVTITTILMVGAAAATVMLFEPDIWNRDSSITQTISPSSDLPDVENDDPPVKVSEEIANEAEDDAGLNRGNEPPAPASQIAVDRASVLVLSGEDRSDGSGLAEIALDLRDSLSARIAQEPGLNLVDGSIAPQFRSVGYSDVEIARQLGAGLMVVIRTDGIPPEDERLSFAISDAEGKNALIILPHVGGDGIQRAYEVEDPDSLINTIIQRLRIIALDETDPENDRTPAELRSTILSRTGSPGARSEALSRLVLVVARNESSLSEQEFLDLAIMAATLDPEPSVRLEAWISLRQVVNSRVIGPALTSFATETDETVRLEVIKALWDYTDDSRVRTALEQATLIGQPEAERNQAAFGLLTLEERAQSRRDNFFNDALSMEERLDVFIELARPYSVPTDLKLAINLEVANELRAIANSNSDWSIRARFLSSRARSELLTVLASDAAENLRAAAASTLYAYIDDPEVHDALTAAGVDDESGRVRQIANAALDRAGNR
jgi:Putative zinc-finger